MPSPWRSRSATERTIASGLAAPEPAMSGAEPWTGSKTPGSPPPPRAAPGGGRAGRGLEAPRLALPAERGARQHPDRAGDHRGDVAEDVAEHVLRDEHVEVGRGGHAAPRGGAHAQV